MSSGDESYSVAVRIRRVTYEDAYVAVPVTDAIMNPTPREDGFQRIHGPLLFAAAVELSKHESVEWRVEETTLEPHPLQMPKSPDRRIVDGYYLNPDDSTRER